MIITLGFFLPIVAYISLYFFLRRKRPNLVGRSAILAAACVAVIAAFTVIAVAYISPQWPEGMQIAWTAIEANNKPLAVGGPREEAVVGWPNGSFTPSLKVTPGDNNQAAIEIGGGSGFIYDTEKDTYLNGDVLMPEQEQLIGSYTFRTTKGTRLVTILLGLGLPLGVFLLAFMLLRRRQSSRLLTLVTAAGLGLASPLLVVAVIFLAPHWPDRLLPAWTQKIEVTKEGTEARAAFYLPNAFIGKAKVYSLEPQIEKSDVAGASQSDDLIRLKQWATGVRLLLSSDGTVHILEHEKIWTAQRSLPCKLSVIWPGLNLPVEIRKEDVKLVMEFAPPWRLVSPMPPLPESEPVTVSSSDLLPKASAQTENKNASAAPTAQEIPLIITSRARPNDQAFLLPLGKAINDPRETLILVKRAGYETVFLPKNMRSQDSARDNVPSEYRPLKVGQMSGITSKTTVRSGAYAFTLATVHDLPGSRQILGLIGVGLFCFFGGLVLIYPRMDADDLWVVGGLVTTLWNLLMLRLLLALRYALAPNHLDGLAVSGVAVAFIGLAVAPGLILLACRLRCDYFARPDDEKSRQRAMLRAFIYLAILAVAFVFEYSQTRHLWENLPEKFLPALSLPFILGLLALLLYIALAIRLIYKTRAGQNRMMTIEALLLGPWCFSADWLSRRAKGWWERLDNGQPMRRSRAIALAVVALLFFGAVPFVLSMLPARKFFQEILVPLLFCWPVAIFWLSSRRHFFPGGPARRPTWTAAIFCALLTVLPVFFLPMVIRDAGSIMAILAIFIPMVCILLAAAPRFCGLVTSLFLVVAFVAAAIVYVNLRAFFPFLPGEAGVRLLTFKEESTVQNYIVFANAVKGEDPGGLPLQKLRNGYQHTWENSAIAHVGGFLGLGFGNAPTRRSQVRQDTIQYDSVFSFFIMSEYGWVGGVSLLLLYAVPLALILLAGRLGFDFSNVLSAVVVGSLFFEAIFHAGMNLNAFPFTGRDLPLLAVNSITDLLRWTILFGAAVMALFWKYDNRGKPNKEAVSIISPNAGLITGKVEDRKRYQRAVIIIACVPVLALLYISWQGWRIANDPKLDEPFGWDGVLKTTAQVIQEGGVRVEPQTRKLRIDSEKIRVSSGMLIEQEVRRFNALSDEERDEEIRSRTFIEHLNRIGSFADYNRVLDEARRKGLYPAQERRPSLFRLVRPVVWDQEDEVETRGEYRVEPNPDFNVQLSFSTGRNREEIPRLTFRDQSETILGPAWVMGRWVLATNTDAPLPWAANLSSALTAEALRLGSAPASARYGTLTLDAALQRAAVNFATEKGRVLYDELLRRLPPASATTAAANWPNMDERRKPPRVALTILSLPNGEALALGGWPRMTSDEAWRFENQREWLPPVDWVQAEAPRTLRFLYEGDRNFDRMVMGSTTKPIWATAVLGVHPFLDRQLKVAGSDHEESEVFGIRLAHPWHVTPSNWRSFNEYLTMSDNRYQVRLGFLGLAEKNGNQVATDGASGSTKESISDGAAVIWRAYPKFPEAILFSKDRPGSLSSLQDTSLAEQLEQMYAICTVHNEMTHRVSFWTKREADNLENSPETATLKSSTDRPTKLFRWISPQIPDFALNTITSPRDYVTLLLGGGTNLWANVDFAAAFATCVTGNTVIAHIVKNDQPIEPLASRRRFVEIAKKVQPGLSGVISQGTARSAFQATGAAGFLNSLHASMGIEAYAKTGTLKASDDARDTSRIVLALIKWQDKDKGIVQAGLVFSIVGEQAQKGTAARWLGEFIAKNQDDIRRMLAEKIPGQSKSKPGGKRK
ncbi:MAG: FtsW/RodA/SpoVE family cell cycle protein [Blastocatellia bacterium]